MSCCQRLIGLAIGALVAGRGAGAPPAPVAPPLAVFEEERLAYRRSVLDLLSRGAFGELEAKARSLRSGRLRFSSGAPVLFDFYAGLDPAEEHVDRARREALTARLLEWKQKQPKSATPRVALVRLHSSLAWEARSARSAPNVTPEGWRGFQDELREAWSIGQDALRLEPLDPVIYDSLLAVGIGLELPRAELDQLFSRGIALDPEYEHIYVVMARNLMPRWHGSSIDLERLASRAADATRARLGDGMYARIAGEGLVLYGGGDFEELKSAFPWPRLKKGFDDLDQAYPNSSFILNSYCLVAMRYGDTATARGLFERLDGHWSKDSEQVWQSQARFEQAWAWIRRPN